MLQTMLAWQASLSKDSINNQDSQASERVEDGSERGSADRAQSTLASQDSISIISSSDKDSDAADDIENGFQRGFADSDDEIMDLQYQRIATKVRPLNDLVDLVRGLKP
jgi:hypothetical protein